MLSIVTLRAQPRRRPSPARHCLMSLSLLGAAAGAAAQTPPDAGRLLREAPPLQRALPPSDAALPATPAASAAAPTPSAAAGTQVAIQRVRLSGTITLDRAVLQALVDDGRPAALDFAQMQALAERVTAHYRAQGYALARAVLPAQSLAAGELEIAVYEGVLGSLQLQADAGLPADRLQARLRRLQAGQPLTTAALEEDLLRLSEVPGVRVQSVLRPGETVGQSALDIRVSPGDKFSGDARLDNYGNRYTGEHRASVHGAFAGVLDFGDTLDLVGVYAGGGYRYARAAWQRPVGHSGLQAGLAQSLMDYRLGKDFAALQANGRAWDTSAYALLPLRRSRSQRLDASATLDIKRFDDESAGVGNVKRAQVLNLGLAGSWLQPGRLDAASLTLSLGHLQLDDGNAATDDAGYRSRGGYAKLSWQLSHERAVGPANSVLLRLAGQLAGKNLDSSEKMDLGGAQAVRAYPGGEASSDQGLLASLEMRQDLAAGWRGKLFLDLAQGWLHQSPLASDSVRRRRLAGVGLGVDAQLPAQLTLQAVVAQRLGAAPSSDADRSPRLWVQLAKSF